MVFSIWVLSLCIISTIRCDVAHDSSLFEAAREGDVSSAEKLLAEQEEVSVKPISEQDTRIGLAEEFLNHKNHVNARAEYDMTPLHYAVIHERVDMVRMLLAHGADANVRNVFHMTPLHYAAALGNAQIIVSLIGSGAQVSVCDEEKKTPLYYAVRNEHEESCRLLLEAHADVQSRDEVGNSPLHKAAQVGNVKLVELLMERQADLRERNTHNRNALDCAHQWGHGNVTKYIEYTLKRASEKTEGLFAQNFLIIVTILSPIVVAAIIMNRFFKNKHHKVT